MFPYFAHSKFPLSVFLIKSYSTLRNFCIPIPQIQIFTKCWYHSFENYLLTFFHPKFYLSVVQFQVMKKVKFCSHPQSRIFKCKGHMLGNGLSTFYHPTFYCTYPRNWNFVKIKTWHSTLKCKVLLNAHVFYNIHPNFF